MCDTQHDGRLWMLCLPIHQWYHFLSRRLHHYSINTVFQKLYVKLSTKSIPCLCRQLITPGNWRTVQKWFHSGYITNGWQRGVSFTHRTLVSYTDYYSTLVRVGYEVSEYMHWKAKIKVTQLQHTFTHKPCIVRLLRCNTNRKPMRFHNMMGPLTWGYLQGQNQGYITILQCQTILGLKLLGNTQLRYDFWM